MSVATGRGPLPAWHLLRHELLFLAWAGMDATLLACLAIAFTPWARYWPGWQLTLLLFLLVLIPFNLARLIAMGRMRPGRQQLLLAGLVVPVIFLALGQLVYQRSALFGLGWLPQFFRNLTESGNPFWIRDLVVIFLVSLAWARGISLSGREVDVDRLGLRFRLDALILAPLLLVLAGPRLAVRVAPLVLAFFLAALLAIALTRAEQTEAGEGRRGHAMSARWFAAVAAASLALVLVGGAFTALTGNSPLAFMNAWLGPVWLAASMGGTTVITTLAYVGRPLLFLFDVVVARLIAVLAWLQGLLQRNAAPAEAVEATDFTGNTWDALIDWLTRPAIGRPLVNLRLVLIGLVLLVVLLAVAGAGTTLARRRLTRDAGPARAPSAGEAPERGGLRGLLDRLTGARRRWRAATVRRIYQQMCDAAEGAGHPRLDAETPYEFLASLARVWPHDQGDTELITHAYVRVRYGEIPETQAELDAIRAAWRRLADTLPAPNAGAPRSS